MDRRILLMLLLTSLPAAAAAQEPIREHISFYYNRITWTYEPSAAPAGLQGTARVLRAPGADPKARRGSFEVLVPKGPLQEFFAYVVQRPATDWQFATRLTCVDATGKRHDLGMQRLGMLSYKETPAGDGTTEQYFTIELSQANLANLEACRSPDDDGR